MKRPNSIGLLATIWVLLPCWPLSAEAAPKAKAQPSSVASALLEQDHLPALRARFDVATARQESAAAWFDGRLDTPAAAFPHLAHLPLLDPAVLAGAISALDTVAQERVIQRIQAPPDGLLAADNHRWSQALSRALDAEDAADGLERRFLLGLATVAARATNLQPKAIDAHIASLRERSPLLTADPPDPAVAAEVLERGRAEAALHTLQDAVVRWATIPGDPQLFQITERDRLQLSAWLAAHPSDLAPAPHTVAQAADRLTRVRPLLPDEVSPVLDAWSEHAQRSTVDQLRQQVEQATASASSAPSSPPMDLAAAEASLRATRDRQREQQATETALVDALRAAHVPAPGIDVDTALRLQASAYRLQLADLEVAAAEREVERARQAQALQTATSQTTDDQVAQAKADAAAAQAEADRAAAEGVENELRQQIATYSSHRAQFLEQRKQYEETAQASIAKRIDELAALRDALAAALHLGMYGEGRQERLNDVYRQSRELVSRIRGLVRQTDEDARALEVKITTEIGELPDLDAMQASGVDSALLTRWREEGARLQADLRESRDAMHRDKRRAMELLAATKVFRREARSFADANALTAVRQDFIEELFNETLEVPDIISQYFYNILDFAIGIRRLLLDLNAIVAFLRGSFGLVALLLLWGFLRDRVPSWLNRGLTTLSLVRPGDASWASRIHDTVSTWGTMGEWRGLYVVAAPVLVHALDGIAGAIVYVELPLHWAVPRTILFLWLARKYFLMGTLLVDVLLAVPGEDRPAARRVSEEGRQRARLTARTVLGWRLTFSVLGALTIEVLDADRMNDLIGWLGTVSGWVIAAGVLHVWSAEIQSSVANDGDDPITRTVSRPPHIELLRAPVAAIALVVLLARRISSLAGDLVDQRTSFGWLRTAMARQSLKNTDNAPTRRLSKTHALTLRTADTHLLTVDAELGELREALHAWNAEQRRGMVAITGQRGSGKSRLLQRLPEVIAEVNATLPIQTIRLDRDIFDPNDVLAWLMKATMDTSKPDSAHWEVDDVARELSSLPPRVFVIDDLHRCFLRAVGGFRGLRQVLTAIHAASERHFWVCTFHGDNWAYLEGVGGAVNLGVFRKRIILRPLSSDALRDWLEGQAVLAGFQPTYAALAADGWSGTDPSRIQQKARTAYFRLLAEATRGNPQAALTLWADSLREGTTPEEISVVLFEQPDPERLAEGGDHALFVLAALVVHDGLDVRDLVRVLNLDEATCRASCRRLQGLGVLESDAHDEHYDITPRWAPVVYRHLRRKHLLHRE